MDRYYMPVNRDEDDSIDHQYKVYDYSSNDYQRSTKAMPSKMKTKYWMGKQQLRQKLGKEENEWVVKGDSALDAKLSYFHHVNHSCNELLSLCERFQHHMKGLSLQECLLGKFLDSRSKHEGTEAGKMMSYIGYAEDYMSKKRNTLYPSVNRLMTDLGVFQQKAVQDCSITVERMEQFRTEFRASLLWLDNISRELNPEDREQLDKFRKVQTLTREKRVEFARMKDNTIQKIEILAASRINLLSARLEEYHLSYQKYLQSSINALQEVVAAKERLDIKIEEKRIADLEAEIDAHNPSKKSTKLISSSSLHDNEENGTEQSSKPPKLKDLGAPPATGMSDDEDLVNLHDDFGDFEAAVSDDKDNNDDLFNQTETLDEIFGRLSPVSSIPETHDMDLMGLDEEGRAELSSTPPPPQPSGSTGGGGLVGDGGGDLLHLPPGVDWFSSLSQPEEGEGGASNDEETIDWTMMNDLLTQPDEGDLLSGPATDQDMLQLSAALANIDTGTLHTVTGRTVETFWKLYFDAPSPLDGDGASKGATTPSAHCLTEDAAGDLMSTEEVPGPEQQTEQTASGKLNNNPNKQQMQPQQFNAWLNLFSELDPIAQSKSGNCA